MELFDVEDEPDPKLNAISNAIIGACIAVHRQLGPPYAEEVYEAALALEFDARGIRYRRQFTFDVIYRDQKVGSGRVDFLVEELVVLELKAVDEISNVHTSQVVAYLHAFKLRLGLVVNFRTRLLKDGVRRVAN